MNPHLDHVIWACHDLERASRRFETLTGIRPQYGGTHASGLTHNALVGLGERCYLEILAPAERAAPVAPVAPVAPAERAAPVAAAPPRDDDWCRFARAAVEPRLFTYCMRSAMPLEDLAPLAATLGGQEVVVAGNGRTTPDGARLRWQWLGPKFDPFGYAFPFFIDWLDSPHPAASFAAAVPQADIRLLHFAVGHPRATELRALLAQLGAPIDTYVAPDFELQVKLDTPFGAVTL